jgi:hypothetical protein
MIFDRCITTSTVLVIESCTAALAELYGVKSLVLSVDDRRIKGEQSKMHDVERNACSRSKWVIATSLHCIIVLRSNDVGVQKFNGFRVLFVAGLDSISSWVPRTKIQPLHRYIWLNG